MKKILLLLLLAPVFAFAQPCADEDTVRANTVSLITATTVRITGTTGHFSGTVLSMQLRYVRVGQTDTATASASGTNALRNLTGLQANTQYVYYYKSVCGSGDRSQTIGAYFFTTLTSTVVYAAERSTVFPYLKSDTGFTVPRIDTGNLYRAANIGGQIRFRPADSTFYGYDGAEWSPFSIDSAGIITALNRKVDSVTVTGDSLFYWINGVSYGYILPAATAWDIAGNAGTTAGTNFLGTTDNQPVVIKSNSNEVGRLNGSTYNVQFGFNPIAGGGYSTVSGGSDNTANGSQATISGGYLNIASGEHSVISGGSTNTASGTASVIAGGTVNFATEFYSTVGGGDENAVRAVHGVISGGTANTIIAGGNVSAIGGGESNYIAGTYSSISGGSGNRITSNYSSILGGGDNYITGTYSSISGGINNKAKSYGGAIVGIYNDSANATSSTSFNALNRAFQIGIGTADNARSNAMTVLFNGKTGIGALTPDSLLTVEQGIYGKRGVRFSGLLSAANAADSMMVVNATNGNVGYRAIPSGGGISGLTTNTITKATSATTIGNSSMTDDGTTLTSTIKSIFSANGAVSAPAITGSGTWYSGGTATTTKPLLLIEPSGTTSTGWNTAGTGLGINAASGFTGLIADAQINGTSMMALDYKGNLDLQTSGSMTNDRSLAVGNNNSSFGSWHIVAGTGNVSYGTGGLNIGSDNTQVGNYGATIGQGMFARETNEIGIGQWGTDIFPATNTTTSRLFNVGNGTGTGARADAFTILRNGNVGVNTISATTKLQVVGRFAVTQGADVASTAGAMTLGTDGNSFEITGTNTVTLLSNVGWVNGSEVTLMFTGAATLTHGTATSGTNITMILAGAANFVASADDVITLVLGEIGGTQAWREKCRSVN